MSTREDRLARFNRVGPLALVIVGAAVVLVVALVRSGHLDRFDLYYLITIIPTIVLHEISHGAMAYLCGDDTAKRAGRLSLNPFRHIDPVGTVILPAILLLFGWPAFGWAKPVPVAINQLRHPRNQAILVSLAGPLTNFGIATVAGVVVRLLVGGGDFFLDTAGVVPGFLVVLGLANVVVGLFNLLPIPPLDGSVLIERLLPAALLPSYYRVRQYFLILVLILVFLPLSGNLLGNLFNHIENLWLNVVFS